MGPQVNQQHINYLNHWIHIKAHVPLVFSKHHFIHKSGQKLEYGIDARVSETNPHQ